MSEEKKPATLDEAVGHIEGDGYAEVVLERRVELIEAYLGGPVMRGLSGVDFMRKDYDCVSNDLYEMKEKVGRFEKKMESYELKQNYMFSLIDGSHVDESKRYWDILRLAERVEKLEAKLVEMEADAKRREEE